MPKRSPLSKKIRFEVFKRDSFRCQYCGRSAPDAILEVDHIVPVADGGDSDIMNLITSCRDCNRGKGKSKLDDNAILARQKAELDELNERREQMEMMIQWREELGNISDMQAQEVGKLIFKLTGERLRTDQFNTVYSLIKRFGFNEVMTSAEISYRRYYLNYIDPTREKFNYAFNKIGGVYYNRIKQGDADNGNL